MTTSSRLLAAAIALAAAAAPLRADNIIYAFYGQITHIQSFAESATLFQVGDSFALTLDFSPTGLTPAYGYYLAPGTQAISPETVTSPIAPYTGFGPPYADTLFRDPESYQLYCTSSITLKNDILSFSMFDEDAGARGSVTVGSDFPTAWFANPADPLPGNVISIPFSASGPLHFNFLNAGGNNLSGTITSAAVFRDASVLIPDITPIPEPASLALVLGAAPALLLRRRRRA